ncbi:MAG: lipoyl(octanoyl) transferase LipB [Candidatus Omnitrophota bacterium]|nr:lipoyl(octanoyl) transferase LipB [Candidatus Omnitrophota bacterium]
MLHKLSLTGLNLLDLGLIDYQEALAKQKEIVSGVINGLYPDTLIFCQHYDIITIGRRGSISNVIAGREELLKKNIKVVFSDRGGDVTYHGKGQLIAYPIFDLRKSIRDVHLFLRRLECAVINLLKRYGISGSLKSGKTGVWVDDEKISSIGIAFSHWVSYHGLSLNVDPDLSRFLLINPCGLKGGKTTSLSQLLGGFIDMSDVKIKLKDEFIKLFYKDCG